MGFRPHVPIQARSVSDGINASFDAAPGMAFDPPAHAEGLYGRGHTSPERKRWDQRIV
jgi:hypothetical protein